MKALILAGGKGTRLGEKTLLIPKPMVEIAGKPILEYQIELLKKYGITDITLLINHLSESIIRYFSDGKEFQVNISYYNEQQPLGTAGGLKEIEKDLNDDFLLLYGDVMVNMDLHRLADFHKKYKSECTLVVHPNDHPYDSDLLDIDSDGRIISFNPKPHKEGKYYRNLVNAGLYLMSPRVLNFIEKGKKADFGHDIFPVIYSEVRMFGYNTSEYLKDMGTPSRLELVSNDIHSGRIERSNYEHSRSCIFLDRDGVLNEDIDLIAKPDDFHLFPFTAEAIKKTNKSEYLTVVATNQSVVARNLCTLDELRVIHNKMETSLGEKGAYLDAVYFCPHHPDKGYPEENKEFKVDCECRKPKPGMLLKAASEYNIDLSNSWIIGDSEGDILAGRSVGCSTIAVKTGRRKYSSKIKPDYWFDNLDDAVSFIIAEPFKEVLDQVLTKLETNQKSPMIIAIGGRAKSGKSVLSSYLSQNLTKKGKKVLNVELDSWILAEGERLNAKNVFDRFQFPLLCNDIDALINGDVVTAPGYSIDQNTPKVGVEYTPEGTDVIIIDGVVALSIPVVKELSHLKIFVNIDNALHKQRIFSYYRWRGKSEEEISCLYYSRLLDEYRIIDRHIDFADIVI